MGINLGNLEPAPAVDIKQEAAGVTAPVATPAPIVLPDGVKQVDKGDGVLTLNLNKGISLDLGKTLPTLNVAKVGLGWNPATGVTMDLDVFALALHNGKVKSVSDITYYQQRSVVPGVVLSEDNRTGEGEGDDETIQITLSQVPADVTEIAIFVNIYEAAQKNQNFGMVNGAYCRIVNEQTGKEEAIYILNESDAALYDAFHFVTFKRNGSGWSFDTIGKGMHGNVQDIANQFLG